MSKRIIREHIIATRALTQLPWPEAAKLFLGQEGVKIRAYKFVVLPYRLTHLTDEEHAEVIALIGAPLSHAQHIRRIGAVMANAALRLSDAMVTKYQREDQDDAKLRRERVAKAEKRRLRKLPRIKAT